MEKTKWQITIEKTNPQWNGFLRAKIISCNKDIDDRWYKDMVGQEIKVKHFFTFGVWDEQNRWLYYHDIQLLETFVFK